MMCNQCGIPLNADQVDAFGEKLISIINGASLSMMLSIGHRTNLFDKMTTMSPATCQQIADEAGLNERYVREWLGAMVTGGIVQYDPKTLTYQLPPEHAAMLTREAGADNFASTMQWTAVLGGVEDEIVDCFRNGGGVDYSAFARFHRVMAEESNQTVVGALTDHILPLAPGVLEGLGRGIDVLDIGCGSGRAMNQLAALFRNSRFSGYDFSEEAIQAAREEAKQRGLTNVRFEVKDVSEIGESATYDLITAFDAIHDQAKPAKVLSEIATALRPDGTFLMQDIAASSKLENNLDHPISPLLYTISTMHCMTVSLAQGGAGLGTCWGKELAGQMLNDAGFAQVDVQSLPHDIMNYYYVSKKE